MKVALAQIAPHLGDVNKNFDLHLKWIKKAIEEKVDLLIFPELSLSGYNLKDLVEDVALRPAKASLFSELKDISRRLSLIVGFVEEKERGLFYNSAAFISGGRIVHIHRKLFLPTYGMLEEGKFFAQGRNFQTFKTPWGKMGMEICYDFLHYSSSYLLFVGGSEIIIVISAAPGRGLSEKDNYQSCRMWELMGEAMSRFSSVYLIYCNRVGFEDGKHFAGGSFIFSPFGQMVAQAPYLDESFLVKKIDLDQIRKARKKWPYRRDEKPEIILNALKMIINDVKD